MALFLALVVFPVAALAQSFPQLTGRVVDAANLLKPEERASLEAKLKAHEDETTNQVVVATVPSLDGLTVEDYANRLFRHWELGQKKTNNGVLLLVAPSERKVRIEVGYGLEGELTDALSKIIITTAIAPQFQQADFAGGIEAGVDAVLSTLSGNSEEWEEPVLVRDDDGTAIGAAVTAFVIFAFFLFTIIKVVREGRRPRRRGGSWVVSRSGWSSGSSSSSSSSGFSGGGGSSGGGGASGSW